MNILSIHGFRVRDGGARSVDTFAGVLMFRGHHVDMDSADYGFHHLLKVRWFHKSAVKRIAKALDTADCVYCHSNGANYLFQALTINPKPVKVILLSPALDADADIPECITELHVFHTMHDKAVRAARWLLWHPWGEMGRVGYTGNDKRVTNYDHSDRVGHHSGWFVGLNRLYFAARVAEICENED